jgi:hypothetical protein
MEPSKLKPFLRPGLDILFVGLNPATVSSRKGHYFSVRSAFWDQLFQSGLITQPVHKDSADFIVFGSTDVNRNEWNYGVTYLVSEWAESKSSLIRPSMSDCARLTGEIVQNRPRVVVLVHSKVRDCLGKSLAQARPIPYGHLGQWLPEVRSEFYAVPFPHGNSIRDDVKIGIYEEVIRFAEGTADKPAISSHDKDKPRTNSSEGNAVGISSSKLELAHRIDNIIDGWLRETGVQEAKPKDVMPVLLKHKIFSADHRQGLPLRKLLRELDDAGHLSVMTTARCERKAKNRLWTFHPSS